MALIALTVAAAFALQPIGSFHDGEAVARDGERWLALRVTPAGAALVDTRAQVRRVHDDVMDGAGARSGCDVATAVHDAAFLLRGPALRAGAVGAVALADGGAALGPAPLDLAFRGTPYRLALDCAAASPRCEVVLHDGRRRQVLFALGAGRYDNGSLMLGDDASPALLFAGDLDRDGRLDLILDVTDHYNRSAPTLYLSSQARAAELVHAVAASDTVGC